MSADFNKYYFILFSKIKHNSQIIFYAETPQFFELPDNLWVLKVGSKGFFERLQAFAKTLFHAHDCPQCFV